MTEQIAGFVGLIALLGIGAFVVTFAVLMAAELVDRITNRW